MLALAAVAGPASAQQSPRDGSPLPPGMVEPIEAIEPNDALLLSLSFNSAGGPGAMLAAADTEPEPGLPMMTGPESNDGSLPDLGSAQGWAAAPVRVWGDVGYEFRRDAIQGFPTLTRNTMTANVNASTYLYEPWFAVLTGGLRINRSTLRDTELAGSDTFSTGYARLNLFPASRFPFEARYEKNDSRIESVSGADLGYKTTRYGATQRVRAADGGGQGSLSFDHYEQDSDVLGRDLQRLMQFDASTSVAGIHQVQMLGTFSRNQRLTTNDETRYETLMARHRVAPTPGLSWENTANVTTTGTRFGGATNDLRFLQASSLAFWRPTDRPLIVSGSLRMFSLESRGDTSLAASDTSSVNGTVGANYSLSRNLRLNGNFSATDTRLGADRRMTTSTQAGALYTSDPLVIGKANYNWYGGSSLIYRTGAEQAAANAAANDSSSAQLPRDRDGLGVSTQLGHTINRVFPLGEQQALSVNAAQNFTALTGVTNESRKLINHIGSITWSNTTLTSAGFLRLNAADSRYLDGRQETYQLVNMQATANLEADRNSSWAGNLTYQLARNYNREPGVAANDARWHPITSADLTYVRRAVFDVPRLSFFTQLRLNRAEVVQTLGSPEQREQKSWESRLDYMIGRLESRLIFRVSELDDKRRWLVMLRFTRRFGT